MQVLLQLFAVTANPIFSGRKTLTPISRGAQPVTLAGRQQLETYARAYARCYGWGCGDSWRAVDGVWQADGWEIHRVYALLPNTPECEPVWWHSPHECDCSLAELRAAAEIDDRRAEEIAAEIGLWEPAQEVT
jgi:hypothetical protein